MTMRNNIHETESNVQSLASAQEDQMMEQESSDSDQVNFEILLIEEALDEWEDRSMEPGCTESEQVDFEILLIEEALREAEERLCGSYDLPYRRLAPSYYPEYYCEAPRLETYYMHD